VPVTEFLTDHSTYWLAPVMLWRIILKPLNAIVKRCCLVLKAGNLLMKVFSYGFTNQQMWFNWKF